MFMSCQHGISSQGTGWGSERVSGEKEQRTEPGGSLMFGNLDHEGCPPKKADTAWHYTAEDRRKIRRGVEQCSSFLFRVE